MKRLAWKRMACFATACLLLALLAPGSALGFRDWAGNEDGWWDDNTKWTGTGTRHRFRVADGDYTVWFVENVDAQLVEFDNGNQVTFDLRGHTLTSFSTSPILYIYDAGLTLLDGTLNIDQRFTLAGKQEEGVVGSLTVGAGAMLNFEKSEDQTNQAMGRFNVGNTGTALITVRDGGVFNLKPNDFATIGQGGNEDASGRVEVTGWGSTLNISPESQRVVTVGGGAAGYGNFGKGYLDVVNSGRVNITMNQWLYVGRAPNTDNHATGRILVSGIDGAAANPEPSTMAVNIADGRRRFSLGHTANSVGTLQVEDGGVVTVAGTGSAMILGSGLASGELPAGHGILRVDTGGSVTTTEHVGVGGDATGTEWVGSSGGKGTLRVAGGGTVDVGDRLYVFDGGEVEIDGGRLSADTLMLSSGSQLAVRVGAHDPANAMITVAGEVRLYGNAFEVEVDEDAFVFGFGDVYRVIGFGTLNADFNRFDGYDDGATITIVAGNPTEYDFQLNYGTLQGHEGFVTLMAIPEPGTLWLLAAGGLLFALRRRR